MVWPDVATVAACFLISAAATTMTPNASSAVKAAPAYISRTAFITLGGAGAGGGVNGTGGAAW